MPDGGGRVGRVVVMGVAGSGKTTVAHALGDRWLVDVVDADELHPAENVAKMSAGEPLTDDDRGPWLAALADVLASSADVVVTCSALKRSYRDVLRSAGDVRFVLLDVDPDTARRRVGERAGHFMGVDMVDSQFATLERPSADEPDVRIVDATGSLRSIVDSVLAGDTVTHRHPRPDRK